MDRLSLDGHVEYLVAPTELDFVSVSGPEWASAWQPLNHYTFDHALKQVWLRFEVEQHGSAAKPWFLVLRWPPIDEAEVRLFHPLHGWGKPMRAGDTVPLSERPFASRHLVYPLDIAPGTGSSVYLKLRSSKPLALPLELVEGKALWRQQEQELALINLFFGGLLVILLYNLSLYVFTRDRLYIHYVAYLATALAYSLGLTGLGPFYLWPDAPEVGNRLYGLSAAMCFFTSQLFARRFLDLPRLGGWPYWVNNLVLAYWALVICAALIAPKLIPYLSVQLAALLTTLTIVVPIYLWVRGYNQARLFTLAWAALIVFTVAHLLALAGKLPLNRFTLDSQLIGIFVEFLLLSMALAERISLERNKRIAAQQMALQASQSLAEERHQHLLAKQQALLIQQQTNEELEARVLARTQALEEVRQGLEVANAELMRLSATDSLTQLANRRSFDRLLDEEIRRARRAGSPLSVLLADIDHFKRVNDTYGHPFGDECLRQVAAVLAGHCQRAGDVAARYGGEEFVVLLPGLDAERAVALAESIRCAIAQLQLQHGGQMVALTVSLGVATLTPSLSAPADLLAAADAALYQAKNAGRDRVLLAPGNIPQDGPAITPQPV